MTTTISPRALTLAASIGWRHVTADPVRALLLAGRVLPAPLRGGLRLAGPYGRAALLWGAGDRPAALAALAASPRRQAAFALAAGQPAAAAEALERLPGTDPARPVLTTRLAWREGRLTDALGALDGARGRQARRLRRALAPQQAFLAARQATPLAPPVTPAPSSEGQPMIVASLGRIATETGHDHEARHAGAAAGRVTPGRERVPGRARPGGEPIPGRVLHLVSDALPSVSAGYTIRTHEIVRRSEPPGLDPHVATRCGFPVTQGILDGRRLVEVDGVPYHRLLPWLLPGHGDADPKLAALAEKLAARADGADEARGAARREQLRQRQDRAGPGPAVRPAGGVRGARVLGGHLAVPAPGRRPAGRAASSTSAAAPRRPRACWRPTWS